MVWTSSFCNSDSNILVLVLVQLISLSIFSVLIINKLSHVLKSFLFPETNTQYSSKYCAAVLCPAGGVVGS